MLLLILIFFFFLEPLFLQIQVVLEDGRHYVHIIYEPTGTLGPMNVGNDCNSFYETYGNFFFLLIAFLFLD